MGGIALFVDLERLRDDATELPRVYSLVFDLVQGSIRTLARARAYHQVLAYYLGSCQEEGSGHALDQDGRRGRLLYSFRDAAGLCCMSMHATQHWFRGLLASVIGTPEDPAAEGPLDALMAHHGWRITEPRECLADLLARSPGDPLLVLRDVLHVAWLDDGRPRLYSDDGVEGAAAPNEPVAARDRKKVAELLESRVCGCAVCTGLRRGKRPRVTLPATASSTSAPRGKRVKPGPLDGDLTTKKEMHFYQATFEALPPQVLTASRLKHLGISDSPLLQLPEEISGLTRLESLQLWTTPIRSLPAALARLPKLRELCIGSASRLKSLEVIGQLPALRELILRDVPKLADAIDGLTFATPLVRSIELSGSKLQRLPLGLTRLTGLQRLNLGNNHLETLPDELAAASQLHFLDLGQNRLATFPPVLGQLKALTILILRDNPLRSIGPELGGLESLDLLDLGYCRKLEHLPDSIARLGKLRSLRLRASALSEAAISRLRELLPTTEIDAARA